MQTAAKITWNIIIVITTTSCKKDWNSPEAKSHKRRESLPKEVPFVRIYARLPVKELIYVVDIFVVGQH